MLQKWLPDFLAQKSCHKGTLNPAKAQRRTRAQAQTQHADSPLSLSLLPRSTSPSRRFQQKHILPLHPRAIAS